MLILAINCGSSSLKCSLIDSDSNRRSFDALVENIGTPKCRIVIDDADPQPVGDCDHDGAMHRVLEELRKHSPNALPAAAAHRIVHGGNRFLAPTLVTDATLDALDGLNDLAPLHNPPAVAALRLARKSLPDILHVAVFDTSFHATLPPHAYEYALSAAVTQRLGIRRYGFHGISHGHVMESVAAYLRKPPRQLRIVSCHLGNGASVAAIEQGRSVETSMGMTPLEGLVMGTRSGDVDPGVLLHLLHSGEYDADGLDGLLNHESGLKGLTGTNDLREIERRADGGEDTCRTAIAMYAHRVRKYIGAYAAVMGGVDVIAFTGGVGENSASMRSRIVQRLEFLGAHLDEQLNRAAKVGHNEPIALISTTQSRVALCVVQADEEAEMVRKAYAQLQKSALP